MKKILRHLVFVLALLVFLSIPVIAANNDITVILDGEKMVFDVPPVIINGRTMVPVRAIFEALGATVEWDGATSTAIAKRPEFSLDTYSYYDKTVKIQIGSNTMYIDGEPIKIDEPATIRDSRTLVPLRAVSEAFSCEVGWDGTDRTISIIDDNYDLWMMYAPGGRSRSFATNKVCAQAEAGWYFDSELTDNEAHWSLNSSFICEICGKYYVPTLNMTTSEKNDSANVEWISQRLIWHDDEEGCFILVFSLLDDSQTKELSAPTFVSISIYNDNNELVFDETQTLYSSNYMDWYYDDGSVKKHQATIRIYDWEIYGSTTDSGTIYFDVWNPDYFSFDTSQLNIYDSLPIADTYIDVPATPLTIKEYWQDDLSYTCAITDITYEVDGDDIYLYFAGEKTYDSLGNDYSRYCIIYWKLYDSEGYVVDSGSVYSPSMKVGEKFRNAKVNIWGKTVPGEVYTLVIENAG